MALHDDVLKELDSLIDEGKRIIASYSIGEMGASSSMVEEVTIQAFATSALVVIEWIAGRDSEFYRQLPAKPGGSLRHAGYDDTHPSAVTGTLVALRRAVEAGLLVRLEQRIRANVYDDFLVQAGELLTANYHVAAMVLVGGVLEDHLRKLCVTRGLAWSGNGSLSKYNDLLRDRLYDQPTWRRIQATGDVRNEAAHGQGARVQAGDVADAHRYVGRFLADFPA